MANSIVERPSGCWVWAGHRTPDGYGTISLYDPAKKRCITKKVHRVAYAELVGPIPEGREVDHLCMLPCCINPNHLQLLPRSENAAKNQWRKREHEQQARTLHLPF